MPLTDAMRECFVLTKQADVAEFCGISRRTLVNWLDAGMPRESTGITNVHRYHMEKIFKWYVQNYSKKHSRGRRPAKDDEDMLMFSSGDSPAMERYREARAKIAEADWHERKNDICRVDQMLAVFIRLMTEMRQDVIDAVGTRFGTEASDYMKDWLARFKKRVDDEFTAQFPRDEGDPSSMGLPADAEGEADQSMGGGRDLSTTRGTPGAVPPRESSGEQDLVQ